VLGSDDGPFEDCWREARTQVEVTEPVREFCAQYSHRAFNCGEWLGIEECESIFGMWSALVMEEIRGCMEQDCLGMTACVTATFD